MSDTFNMTVITPERRFFEGKAQYAEVPGYEGDIGIYSSHSPLFSILRPGVIHIEKSEKEIVEVFVAKGFVEIMPDKVNILADYVETVDEIDIERAEKAKQRALAKINTKKHDGIESAYAELQRAEGRLAFARRSK
ncbi:MAG: ATP synthase F1 subunit epsilon [Candidatus Margulisiibacteriota bacterium]|nr:MAG: ATP synthase F1 subunit epsilon [Candidatus Margulisbacteria bacterium GWD2_39_127]OGI02773.1 MAG: ATP synthase F1 subunit epsilon [Candidatus Margulisbacteria bacterium GWF2_38_17]OGI09340.1 MAG: ATP synthase F1 subunit epsilon [Candidatus Margulisbacteria bacterium GWE2_39_32]PZM77446.1 MAG: ATP synthase F1 subunit epsilon [Candidatus Margulisiibacteriota bacterium]HAR63991.1 ATP synthase F1 subunit epsilon [Candidatus Margulisiibacteriota bacterium]